VLPISIFNAFRIGIISIVQRNIRLRRCQLMSSSGTSTERQTSGNKGAQMSFDKKKGNNPLANIVVTKSKNPSAEVSATRPKNPSANLLPTEGYVLEVDGKYKTEYQTSEDALKAGLELKKKFPYIQVYVYGAKERTRTLVSLPE
jgi:hypothetical protein